MYGRNKQTANLTNTGEMNMGGKKGSFNLIRHNVW